MKRIIAAIIVCILLFFLLSSVKIAETKLIFSNDETLTIRYVEIGYYPNAYPNTFDSIILSNNIVRVEEKKTSIFRIGASERKK